MPTAVTCSGSVVERLIGCRCAMTARPRDRGQGAGIIAGMSLIDKMTLYPIHAVGQPFLDDEPFDDALLPAQVVPDVSVEKVAGLLTPTSFDLWNRSLSPDKIASTPGTRSGVTCGPGSEGAGAGDWWVA
jgi:hypothetical protein